MCNGNYHNFTVSQILIGCSFLHQIGIAYTEYQREDNLVLYYTLFVIADSTGFSLIVGTTINKFSVFWCTVCFEYYCIIVGLHSTQVLTALNKMICL